jgi:tetratricopeptide (TPR) repeat protein
VYVNLSISQSKKGNPNEAEKNIQRAIEMADPAVNNTTIAKAYVILGESYAATDDNDKAKTAFEYALRFDGDNAAAKTNLEKLKGAN